LKLDPLKTHFLTARNSQLYLGIPNHTDLMMTL